MSNPTPEFEAQVHANIWETNLQEVIDFIKEASGERTYTPGGDRIGGKLYWSWVKNPCCKYVGIRIDLRNGAFVILDRDGQRISLEQLKYQHDGVTYE